MSTRANIIIKDAWEKMYFYRHSDGYPEGALPTLEKFCELVNSKKIRDNASQASGWLIILGAEEYKEHQIRDTFFNPLSDNEEKAWEGKIPSTPRDWKVGAYEPTSCIYGGIEYLYIIDLAQDPVSVEVTEEGFEKYK
jgi:hypothetical protein